jgi:PAS domain S-box-containing protein
MWLWPWSTPWCVVTGRRAAASPESVEAEQGLLVGRRDGTILAVNDVFCRLVGQTQDKIVGRSASGSGLADELRTRWISDRLPTSGQGYRYLREIDTAGGLRPVEVELHSVLVGDDELIVATVQEVAAQDAAAGEAGVLASVLGAATVGMVVYDQDLRILRVNRCAEEMGRITPTHIGMRLEDAVPNVSPTIVNGIRQVFATGEAVANLETHRDGDQTYLLNLFPIGTHDGVVDRVGCIFSDVTDRATAERVTRELAAIVTSSDDAILSKDLDGTIRSWNAGAERLYGFTVEEAIGQPITIIVPDELHGETKEILRKVGAGECVEHYETYRHRKDGSLVDVSLTVSPLHGEQGAIVAASVIARDVTDRRVAEARRSAIVQAALDAIVTMDADGRIVEFNPAAERIFGYTGDRMVGQLVSETLVPPEHRDAHRQGLAQYHATGTGPLIGRQIEVTAMRADGSVFPAEIAINVLPLDRNLLFTAHIRDVSRRREAEHALVESEQRRRQILASLLQAEESERSRIATELHDDTVQVMAASLIALDRVALVAVKTGNEPLASAVALARATLEEATDRTRRLMFELRPAILHERGLLEALRVLVNQVSREVDADGDVLGTPARFDPVVEELVYRTAQEALANVRKHARPSTITVTLTEHLGMLKSEIQDDGRGFDLAEVRSRPGAVLHLGLDTMIERIRAAGGDLTINSAPGIGTNLDFTVPTVLS